MSLSEPKASSFSYTPLDFKGQYPHSNLYNDCYFKADCGVEESSYVYLNNKAICTRFGLNPQFVIAEIGFGVGLNFLTTMELWLKTAPPDNTLIYISCERHPISPEDLKKALEPWQSSLHRLPDLLLEAYQAVVPGLNTFVFNQHKVLLILLIGDALSELSLCSFQADHWILDGFTPKRNPDAWSDPLIEAISRLSHKDTTLATFSAAAEVRRNLKKYAWNVSRIKGFGTKLHSVNAQFTLHEKQRSPNPCLIIGAGIAGLSFQYMRSWLGSDAHCVDGPWITKASMIPSVYGHVPVHHSLTPVTMLGLRSHLMSGHFYRQFAKEHGLFCDRAPAQSLVGVKRVNTIIALSQTELYRRIITLEDMVMHFPQGFSLEGPQLLHALKQESQLGVKLVHCLPSTIKEWQLDNPEGYLYWANGLGFVSKEGMSPPALIRGQQSAVIVNNKVSWLKGSHERHAFSPLPQYDPQQHSNANATSYRSDFVGFRSVTKDYMPIFGLIAEKEWGSLHHGSRGYSTGLWCGLILALRSLNLFSYDNDGRWD